MLDSVLTKNEYRYNAKAKYYPNGTVKITVFSRGIFNPDGYEVIGEKPLRELNNEGRSSETRSDSIKRAKDKIFDIAFMNESIWEYMVTFTLDGNKIDRYDEKGINKKFKKWLNHQTERKNLKYLIIPERHKDGAIHFHGLINADFNYVDSGHKDKSGRTVYNIKDYPFGFSSAVKLDGNKIAVAKYVTKYITKGTEKIMGNFTIVVVA